MDNPIETLHRVTTSLQLCTRPCKGHSDPLSINDCWNEVSDAIALLQKDYYSRTEVLKIIGRVIDRAYLFGKSGETGIPVIHVQFKDLLKNNEG